MDTATVMVNKYLESNFSKYLWLIISQGGIQIIGLIIGVLLVRFLPIEEYAYYTIGNAVLGMLLVVSNSGISQYMMAKIGSAVGNINYTKQIIHAGMFLRFRMSILGLVVSIPILIVMLNRINAPWLTIILIVISIIFNFYLTLDYSIYEIIPKLNSNTRFVQKNNLINNILRLFLNLFIIIIPFAYFSILVTALTQWYNNLRFKKKHIEYYKEFQSVDKSMVKEFLTKSFALLPSILFYAFSGQITIFMLTMYAETSHVAQIGALGRIAMVSNVFTVIISLIYVPHFIKIIDNKRKLVIASVKFSLQLVLMLFLSLVVVFVFDEFIIEILGKNYVGLEIELLLVYFTSCISVFITLYNNLILARKWVVHPILYIGSNILFIIIGFMLFELNSLQTVIFYNLYIATSQLLLHVGYFYFKIVGLK